MNWEMDFVYPRFTFLYSPLLKLNLSLVEFACGCYHWNLLVATISHSLYFNIFTASYIEILWHCIPSFLNICLKELLALSCLLLQDRNYVTVKNRVLFPEFRGRMVSFELQALNLLFVGMKIPLLCCTMLLIYVKRRLQVMLVLLLVAWIFGINWFISSLWSFFLAMRIL